VCASQQQPWHLFSATQSDVGRKRVGGSGLLLLLLHNLSLLNLKSPHLFVFFNP
jgi:hypothetical protein